MSEFSSRIMFGMTALLCLVLLALGLATGSRIYLAAGAAGLCYVLLRAVAGRRRPRAGPAEPPSTPSPSSMMLPVQRERVDPNDTDALVEQMMAEQRYALLLRPQIARNLSEDQFARALGALGEAMAPVPDGEVVLGHVDDALEDGKLEEQEVVSARARVIQVQRLFLDRYLVTNRQYYEFVSGGGYEQTALWDKSMFSALGDFVDSTGVAGPRYWKDGCFLAGSENHPVVGISWYEASAFARWLGKRLPSEAEWVKAASSPMSVAPNTWTQRRYPWGNTMDLSRVNLWGSGSKGTVPVDRYPGGASVGGVQQMIGNVWEWTSGDFAGIVPAPGDRTHGGLILSTPMKSIRGGAFDTYFDVQATCQFQSGENPLSRRRNIGFRCAVGACDLVPDYLESTASDPADEYTEEPAGDDRMVAAEEVHA